MFFFFFFFFKNKIRAKQEKKKNILEILIQTNSITDTYGLDLIVVLTILRSDFYGQVYENNNLVLMWSLICLFVAILLSIPVR